MDWAYDYTKHTSLHISRNDEHLPSRLMVNCCITASSTAVKPWSEASTNLAPIGSYQALPIQIWDNCDTAW
jgi:hypothetical protein